MKKIINYQLLFSIFLSITFIIFLFYPMSAFAAGLIKIEMPDAIKGTPFTDVASSITAIFNIVVGSAGAIFVVLFLIGGIQYLVSAGNEEATGKAKKLLVDAIIGLIIVLAAWAMGTWILSSLKNENSNNGVTLPSTTTPSQTAPAPAPIPIPDDTDTDF